MVDRPADSTIDRRHEQRKQSFCPRVRLATPVSLLLAPVTLGLFGFVGVRLFEPDLIGGLVSGTPLWMKVSGIVALLPVLHIAVAPVLHAALLLLVSLVARLLLVCRRRGMTPYGWRKQHRRPRWHR
jgi:hypothetical protein